MPGPTPPYRGHDRFRRNIADSFALCCDCVAGDRIYIGEHLFTTPLLNGRPFDLSRGGDYRRPHVACTGSRRFQTNTGHGNTISAGSLSENSDSSEGEAA